MKPEALLLDVGIGRRALDDSDMRISELAVGPLERAAQQSTVEAFGLLMGETRQHRDPGPDRLAAAGGADAYVFGYPLVTMEVTRRVMTNVAALQGNRADQANRLPAPTGKFILMLRMYWPSEQNPSILDG